MKKYIKQIFRRYSCWYHTRKMNKTVQVVKKDLKEIKNSILNCIPQDSHLIYMKQMDTTKWNTDCFFCANIMIPSRSRIIHYD